MRGRMLDQRLPAHAVPRLVQSVETMADDPDSKHPKRAARASLIGERDSLVRANYQVFEGVSLRRSGCTWNTANSEFSNTLEIAPGIVAGMPSVRLLTMT